MANPLGARKDGQHRIVSSGPSINKTGPNKVPVGYPVIGDLADAVGTSPNVAFNRRPAYHRGSHLPNCKGDSAGDGKGVRSDTVNGPCHPDEACTTVFLNGMAVVRVGDRSRMQGGNCMGVHVAQPEPAGEIKGGMCTQSTCPPAGMETPKEKGRFRQWLEQKARQIQEALNNPVQGAIGAAKGMISQVKFHCY